jgi:predicted metalloprotease with PDZ domain
MLSIARRLTILGFGRRFLLPVLLAMVGHSVSVATVDTIQCRLEISPQQIDIELRFPSSTDSLVTITTSTWAGVDDLAGDFTNLKAENESAQTLKIDTAAAGAWLVHTDRRPFRLTYSVANKRESFMGGSRTDQFHVALFDSWMFAWGYGCIVELDDSLLNSLPVRVAITSPKYGAVTCNRDLDTLVASLGTLSESVFAAGDYANVTEIILGATVQFLIQQADWTFTESEFFGAVTNILNAQAEALGSYPTDRMLIVLNEGQTGSTGGTVIEDAIALSADPALPLTGEGIKTLQLIAHENMHVWNGNCIHPEESRSEGYYKWFQEGVTDYYSWLTLYRTGELSDSVFIESINALVVDYYQNPYATSATNDTLAEQYWANNDYRTLPYRKGALIGLLIDLTMRKQTDGSTGLDSLLRALMADPVIRGRGYDENSIRLKLEAITGENWEAFFTDYVSGAKLLPLASVFAATGIVAGTEPTAIFDLGFDLDQIPDSKQRRVRSVRPASPADSAGIKQGDLLIGWSYKPGELREPVHLKVQRDSGVVEISYLANREIPILRIRTSPANRTAFRKLLLR